MTPQTSDYDEDLNQNPFFRTFLQNYLDLFSQCVLERWLICVPRKDSLPPHGRFTIEDFTHHILKPLNHVQELNYIVSNGGNEIDSERERRRSWSTIGTDCAPASIMGNDVTGSATNVNADGDSSASVVGSGGSTFGGSRRSSLNALDTDTSSCVTPRNHGHRQYRKWNFETLSGCKLAYDYNTLFLDQCPGQSDDFAESRTGCDTDQPRIMRVLFEETFYTTAKQKYKVLCVAAPLNSRAEDAICGHGAVGGGNLPVSESHFGEREETDFPRGPQAPAAAADPSEWTLCSLRDTIDFIWLHGKRGALETYDGLAKLFLHNHKSLEELPLRVQRDLVADVYRKCLAAALKPRRKLKHKNGPELIETITLPIAHNLSDESPTQSRLSGVETESLGTPTDQEIDIPTILALAQAEEAETIEAEKYERYVANFKLATETYILNALYRPLMNALSSSFSLEDAQLNKTLRNLADIQPKDLHINEVYWKGLGRAKLELSKIANLGSPLAKLDALRRTMNQLKLDPNLNTSSEDKPPSPPLITSADELLPMWVYLVIKTPIGNWMAQLEFLNEFRFAAFDAPGSENTFINATLEAAVTHVYADRATSCYYREFGGGTLVEDRESAGSDEESRSGNRSSQWLPANFMCEEEEEDGDKSPTAEALSKMFGFIRAGNLGGLQSFVEGYEAERQRELKQLAQGVDVSKLCHPLCVCSNCSRILHPEADSGLTKSAFELQTETGVSLLHMACICGRPKIVEYLLGNGASSATTDNLERTPLHYAAIRGHQNALLLLCHSGCALEPLDHMQNTPLHYATLNGHDSCMKALIYYAEHRRQPINMSSQNCNGDTPLHFASRNGYQSIVQILVENGASITLVNARQLSSADCAHNVHVTRILNRSLRRRSLCNVANYGDFVSIEVMKKEISPGQDRVLMLISDPNEGAEQEADPDGYSCGLDKLDSSFNASVASAAPTKRVHAESVGRRSRKTSYSMLSNSASLDVVQEGKMFLNTGAGYARRNSISLPLHSNSHESGVFQVQNPKPEPTFEPEHFKTISVDNLENTPVAIAAAAMSAPGVKRKRKEIGVRKLFTAIAVGDVPLALFYLGIPTDELQQADTIRPGDERDALAPCHPLCTCTRCVARGAGLGLDVDTKNLEGLSPLHLAVMYNLLDLVRILCKYGVDIGLRSSFEHKTAAEMAYERQFHEIEDTLEAWRVYYEIGQQDM